MVVKMVIITLLKAYRIESVEKENELKFISELVLVNANGIKLKITPRTL